MSEFVHLRLHTEYSLSDGLVRVIFVGVTSKEFTTLVD